jgi:hypothetical protein
MVAQNAASPTNCYGIFLYVRKGCGFHSRILGAAYGA